MRRIAAMNYKGGTGKTTTVVNMAHGLALQGYRVLLIDTDPQGSVGYSLGIQSDVTLYDVILNQKTWRDAIVPARPNLDLIVANERLYPASLQMGSSPRKEFFLADRLADLDGYDFVFVDSAPSFNILNQNALVFADEIIMPVSMDYLSLVGVKQLLKNIQLVNRVLQKSLSISMILPTFFDKRYKKTNDVLTSLKRVFPNTVSSVMIRHCVDLSQATSHNQTIFEYNLKSKSIDDFQKLISEVLKK